MTSLPEAEKGGAAKQRPYPLILPAHSERGFPFFCLNRAASFSTFTGRSPTERQSTSAKLLKLDLNCRICLATENLTSDGNFLSKTARCRRIALASLPHIGVPSVMVTGAPLVSFWAFPYNWNHHSARNICFLPVSLRGVGNEQSIMVLGF